MATLTTVPTEMLSAIFSELDDLQSILSLQACSSPCRKAFVGAERQILTSLLTKQFAEANVTIEEAISVIHAREINMNSSADLDAIYGASGRRLSDSYQIRRNIQDARARSEVVLADFVKTHPQNRSIVANDITKLSLPQTRQLVVFHHQIGFLIETFINHTTSREAVTGRLQKPISNVTSSERRRITLTLYLWEIWVALTGSRPSKDVDRRAPAISETLQASVYFDQFTPCQIETLLTWADHVMFCYKELFSTVKHLVEQNPTQIPGYISKEDGGYLLEGLLRDQWDVRLPNFLSFGIDPLFKASVTSDMDLRCTILVNHMVYSGTALNDVLEDTAAIRNPIPSQTRDQPPGWAWAYERELDQGIPPEISEDNAQLRSFGYVFWDEERLREWGTIVGGRFVWDAGDRTIRERTTGRSVSRRQSAEWNVSLWNP